MTPSEIRTRFLPNTSLGRCDYCSSGEDTKFHYHTKQSLVRCFLYIFVYQMGSQNILKLRVAVGHAAQLQDRSISFVSDLATRIADILLS
jgi:hypothetical protein